jgi:predicted outer membrane repeat protein
VWSWEGYAKPVIFTDAYLGLWWHAWLTCEGIVDSGKENINVCFWTSMSNNGTNWGEETVLFGDYDDEAWRDPDGSIGTPEHRLYVTCFNTDNSTLYSVRTEDFTGAWLPPVSVYKFPEIPNHPVDPEIEAAVDYGNVLICCTKSFAGNDNIGTSWSDDGGDTWSYLSSLTGYTAFDEYAPALHRNDYGGNWHLAYTSNKCCYYSAAPQDMSGFFEDIPDRVDDTGTVDAEYFKKGIASSWMTDVPSVAWADFRDGQPDLDTYFDRVDDPNRLYVPEEYASVQAAINASSQYNYIHVNAGTYSENIIIDDKGIQIRSVYGPDNTTLDGGHSGSVVTFMNNDYSSLEGFTIRNGYAGSGGGIYCDASSPMIRGNVIRDNEAWYGGGGAILCITDKTPRIYKNWIFDNHATTGNGGAIYASEADPSISCNVIFDNSAAQSGGAVYCQNSEAYLSANTITKNTAGDQGGGIHIEGPDAPEIWNSIFWNNTANSNPEIHIESGSPTVYYTDVKGGFQGGTYCFDADPLFVDPDNDDYQLSRYSPCINTGSWYNSSFYDILWRRRPQNGTKDLGAYEFMGPHTLSPDRFGILESQHSVVNLTLDAGAVNAKRPYMIFGGVSNSAPGVPLPNCDKFLPINWDVFTDIVMELVNTPVFVNFSGTLDSQGKASATIDTLGPLPPGTAYMELFFAYACPYQEPDGWFASNPIKIKIVEG